MNAHRQLWGVSQLCHPPRTFGDRRTECSEWYGHEHQMNELVSLRKAVRLLLRWLSSPLVITNGTLSADERFNCGGRIKAAAQAQALIRSLQKLYLAKEFSACALFFTAKFPLIPFCQMGAKVVLVTGCTKGGIGYALCVEFAKRGCTVFATARKLESMGGLKELGCRLLPLDITDETSVRAAVARVLETSGRIDILINNAGLSGRGALAEYDIEEAKRQFNTNVFGTMAMVQAAVPSMIAQRSGTIINVGSALGLLTFPFASVYCASKKAVQSMTDSLRMELAGSGVKVVYCAPGWVKTNIIDTMSATGLNCLNTKGPWYPCAPYITGNLYQVEAKHAWTAEQFAESFCTMALSSNPPRVWLNSFRDGWMAYLGSFLVPSFIMDRYLQLKYNLGSHLFSTMAAY